MRCVLRGVRVVLLGLQTGGGDGVREAALSLLHEGCMANMRVRTEVKSGGGGKVVAMLALQLKGMAWTRGVEELAEELAMLLGEGTRTPTGGSRTPGSRSRGGAW